MAAACDSDSRVSRVPCGVGSKGAIPRLDDGQIREVARQGALDFNRPILLLQALASAGGFTQFANKQIVVLRQSEDGEQRFRVNYKKLVAGESSEQNMYLQPGDTLLVD